MGKRGMNPKQASVLRKEKGLKETKLQKLRVKKGVSQNELAKMSGVLARSIRYYEQGTGQIDKADLQTLCKLSKALDCKVADLLENKKLIELYHTVK